MYRKSKMAMRACAGMSACGGGALYIIFVCVCVCVLLLFFCDSDWYLAFALHDYVLHLVASDRE